MLLQCAREHTGSGAVSTQRSGGRRGGFWRVAGRWARGGYFRHLLGTREAAASVQEDEGALPFACTEGHLERGAPALRMRGGSGGR